MWQSKVGGLGVQREGVVAESEIWRLKFGGRSWGWTSAHTTSQLCPPWPISCSLCSGHLGQGWHSKLLNNNWKWYNSKRRGVPTSGSHCFPFMRVTRPSMRPLKMKNTRVFMGLWGPVALWRAGDRKMSWQPSIFLSSGAVSQCQRPAG